jgi:hypothetical protein
VEKGILQALCYADIFDYPLTEEEIRRWEIKEVGRSGAGGEYEQKDGYFFLKGRGKIVKEREKREKVSKEKLELARKVAKKLSWLPTIKIIGLTGALAMNNAKEEDDIDFLIITSRNSLWLTRILIWLICPILRVRRRGRDDKKVKDKICFNLFLDESSLKIEPENLFLAHEICQIKPLTNKDKAYEKFLATNSWVKKYLPNALPGSFFRVHSSNDLLICRSFNLLISFLNKIAFRLQYCYMKSKITSEKISLTQAFFHPKDLRLKVLKEYQRWTGPKD